MGDVTGTPIGNFYKDLLQVSNSNSGIDGTLRNVEDAEGTSSPLQLSSSAVHITSNLGVDGTVDGRDIAADGTKLDGIEAGSDVTDAANVASAGAVMDSDFSTNGIMVRTASGTYTNRSVVAGSTKITVADGDGVSGNISVDLQESNVSHDNLADFVADEHINWKSTTENLVTTGDVSCNNATFTGNLKRSVEAGITASTTQSQGQGPITKDINEYSVVANANDTCTLPTAAAGLEIVIKNNGANTLQIFPASGDNLGAGVDTSTTLAAGGAVRYVAYDSTNWIAV